MFVGAVGECRGPIAGGAERTAVHGRCGDAVFGFLWRQGFWTFEEGVGALQAPVCAGVYGEASTIGIEAAEIEVVAVFVGLAAVEEGAFELHGFGEEARGEDAERNMRGVLPVVGNGGEEVVFCRRAVHECDRADGGLAYWGGVELESKCVRKLAVVQRRDLHEEIVWMLAVVEWGTVVCFAALQKKRIAVLGDCGRLEAHHGTERETAGGVHDGGRAEVVAGHEHSPIDAAELLVTASASLIVVLEKCFAVEHDVPCAEHVVDGVHG